MNEAMLMWSEKPTRLATRDPAAGAALVRALLAATKPGPDVLLPYLKQLPAQDVAAIRKGLAPASSKPSKATRTFGFVKNQRVWFMSTDLKLLGRQDGTITECHRNRFDVQCDSNKRIYSIPGSWLHAI